MPKRSRPRRGSLQYWPRKRAKRIYPRMSHYPASKDVRPLGFAGWKAGMTRVQMTDPNSASPTYGKILAKTVTVIDAPSLFVCAARFYKKTASGLKTTGEKWAESIPKEINIERKTLHGKGSEKEGFDDIRLVVCTQSGKSGMKKKKPELFELAIGGESDKKKEYALSLLGKEISAEDVFKAGDFVDVSAVSKGHGFEGPVKRFGVRLGTRKSKQAHRHTGSMGPTTPSHISWTVPQAGQHGFSTRTEYNKRIVLIDDDVKKINPKSGFVGYGVVPKSFILIEGSVPGHRKRLVRIRKAIRTAKFQPVEIKSISIESTQGR